jgi:hypothetical protein
MGISYYYDVTLLRLFHGNHLYVIEDTGFNDASQLVRYDADFFGFLTVFTDTLDATVFGVDRYKSDP